MHGLLSALAPKGGRACADRRVDGSRINRRANEIFFGGEGSLLFQGLPDEDGSLYVG